MCAHLKPKVELVEVLQKRQVRQLLAGLKIAARRASNTVRLVNENFKRQVVRAVRL
jgi:hypothetical protein